MLINLRNALMAGTRLPYDAEVEYLESTGTQYVDTGVKGNENTRVELCISTSSLYSGAYSSIFGYYGTNIDSISIFGGGTTRFGSQNTSFASPAANTIYQIAIDKTGFTVNGTTTSWSQSAQFETAGNLIAFGRNVATYGLFSGKYYSLKIYQNGTLVRDFIPVRRGTTGYLYDRVSGKLFGNAGTGDFVLGPDVVPVEWLESDGYSYIQTNILPSAGLRTKLRWAFVRNPIVQNSSVFGSRSSGTSTDRYWLNYDGHFEFGYGNYHATNVTVLPLEVFDVDFNYIEDGDHKFKINNSAFTASGTPNTSVAIPLFGRIVATTPSRQASRGYYAEFIRDGVGVGKFLPVRVGTGSTWEGAMMDVLTRRIYRNAGTGAFTYGNDLKYPIPA